MTLAARPISAEKTSSGMRLLGMDRGDLAAQSWMVS
jgi:hypothetical protein